MSGFRRVAHIYEHYYYFKKFPCSLSDVVVPPDSGLEYNFVGKIKAPASEFNGIRSRVLLQVQFLHSQVFVRGRVCFMKAVATMVEECCKFVDQTPNMSVKLKLIDTLRTVTEGKASSYSRSHCSNSNLYLWID